MKRRSMRDSVGIVYLYYYACNIAMFVDCFLSHNDSF